jgi:signal transduction histidine kinase
MKLKSLRFQLPLSYAAIALLAILVLGVVLLLVLRSYYEEQERTYLEENGKAMSLAVAGMLESGLPASVLQAQIEHLSFLTLARIRVLDAEGSLLIDTGIPETIQIASLSRDKGLTQFFVSSAPAPGSNPTGEGEPADKRVVFVGGDANAGGVALIPFEKFLLPGQGVGISGQPDIIGFIAPLGQSMYGFDLSSAAMEIGRSDEAFILPLFSPSGGKIGSLELSDGPAYGRQIVNTVAWAWFSAGLLAVVLAAGAGWLVSRRITAPVLQLTDATVRMAEGDLSARSGTTSSNEFGTLGRSFDRMAEQIENVVSTLRRFVADAAHELNTPLTAVQTDLELARTTDDFVERRQLLERIEINVVRLEGLVRSLLDLSRLEGSTNLPIRQPVDLTALSQSLGEIYASQAEQSGIDFRLDVPKQPVLVTGDPSQLRTALENLLENALKFTPPDGTVRLSLEEQAAFAVLTVEDTGIGIPEEDLPALFQRFHRGRNAAAYPGNGLGLAIVSAVANAHGGKITGGNTGQGSVFTFEIPLK